MFGVSYWIVPLFSGLVWLSMLLGMILTWVIDGRPHLASFNENQHIPYISDIGAWRLKPMFIAMGTITVVSFDIAFIAERWLRHVGRLASNTSWWQKSFSILTIIASIAGAAGLILLSIFDTLRHPKLHDDFLAIFIVGYIISAIFVCAEYQRLGIHYREHRVLRLSFWFKLAFILVEIALAVAFGTLGRKKMYNSAAIVEWIIALVYAFYVLSFVLDFVPAVDSSGHRSGKGMTEEEKFTRDSAVAPGNRHEHYNDGAQRYDYTRQSAV